MRMVANGVRGINLVMQIGMDRALVFFAILLSLVAAAALSAHLMLLNVPAIDGLY